MPRRGTGGGGVTKTTPLFCLFGSFSFYGNEESPPVGEQTNLQINPPTWVQISQHTDAKIKN
jgi:hypothetical protein